MINRAFRGLSGTYNVRANERDRGAPQNIECLVQFLNNTHHKFVLDRRSKGQYLLDCVFKHLNLIETDFFGLKYLPEESQQHQNDIDPTANTGTSRNILLTRTQSLNSLDHSSSSNNNQLPEQPTLNDAHPNHINLGANAFMPPTATDKDHIQNSTTTPAVKIDKSTNGVKSSNNNINHNSIKGNDLDCNNLLQQLNNDKSSSTFVEERWLDPTKSIRKQYKSGPPFKFYFRVKFYVSDPRKLADDTTRHHLYLQLRQDILNNRLIVPFCSAILLASYTVQSEVGDYKRELEDEDYLSNFKLLPNQSDDIKKKVIELHKQHKSLSPADAEYQFLQHAAKKLDCYGIEFYDAKDSSKTNVQIGVSSNGIVVSKDSKRINQISWIKIAKIMFKKKIFSLQLRRDEGEKCDNFIEYNLLSNQACKSFWEDCVAQHSFFGLHQPKSPPKKFFSFLNFGSKFQYNGKTEYQTMEESRKRTFSHFSRSPSKRYARRTLPIGRPSWSDLAGKDIKKIDADEESHQNTDSQSTVVDSANSMQGDAKGSSWMFSRPLSITALPDKSPEQIPPAAPIQTLADSIKAIKKGLERGDDGKMKLIEEFEKLSRKKEDESLSESNLSENIDKNRYRDILPYDSTRVPLIDSMTGDYINASFVDMVVPSGNVNRYIATQGPLASTCDDFWQMVWEQNCSLIIMVTPLIEAGRVKCHKYWPDEKDEIRYGQIKVRNLHEKSKTATIGRTIQLTDAKVGFFLFSFMYLRWTIPNFFLLDYRATRKKLYLKFSIKRGRTTRYLKIVATFW